MSASECIVCHGVTRIPLFRTRDRHYGIPGEFTLVRCETCGLVCMDPIPTDAQLAAFYAEDYYAYQPPKEDSVLKRLAKSLLRTTIVTHDPAHPTQGDFLDIGCGSGAYLLQMKARGWKVTGVEPSQFGVSEGQRAGLDIVHGTLLDAAFRSSAFDYIRSNHSFEHVPNPVQVLAEIQRILKPGGRLYIGVPNIDSLPFRLFGKYWWYLGVPVHTYNYSVATLSTLLRQQGFQVEKVYFNANYTSLLGSLQIFVNRRTSKRSTEGRLLRNPLLMLAADLAVRGIDAIHQGDAIEVIACKPAV